MAGLLAGKAAAITGGVSGTGRAIALEYLRQGAKVAINHFPDEASQRHFESLKDEAPKSSQLISVAGDVGNRKTGEDIVQAVVREFGHLDVFVANAGLAAFRDFLSIEEEIFESHLHTNVRGTFWTTNAAARQLVKQGKGGSIIGVSSISAHLGGTQQVHYTPTKAAILSMMQSQACALGKHGIRCNALLPGTTRTPLSAEDLSSQDKLRYIENRTPLGRVGDPHDMAGPAVFLASDMSKFVTGAALVVDGGLSISLQ